MWSNGTVEYYTVHTHNTGISSGIADVTNVQYEVSAIQLPQDKLGSVEGRLLTSHRLPAVVRLTITHICTNNGNTGLHELWSIILNKSG